MALSTTEIKALRAMLIEASKRGNGSEVVFLSHKELDHLTHLLRSNIAWREWLVPGE